MPSFAKLNAVKGVSITIGRVMVQTPLGAQLGLGTQPYYIMSLLVAFGLKL